MSLPVIVTVDIDISDLTLEIPILSAQFEPILLQYIGKQPPLQSATVKITCES